MNNTLILCYISGWVLSSLVALGIGRRADVGASVWPIAILSATMWPVLAVGAVQWAVIAGALAAVRRLFPQPAPLPASPQRQFAHGAAAERLYATSIASVPKVDAAAHTSHSRYSRTLSAPRLAGRLHHGLHHDLSSHRGVTR
jgi:hypothetical protein